MLRLGDDRPKVSLESMPPGANASLSSGGSCRTPCSLPAPDKTGDYNVTYGFAGYAAHAVPVHVTVDKPNWYSSETTTISPNHITATLQREPHPAPARKR